MLYAFNSTLILILNKTWANCYWRIRWWSRSNFLQQ